MKTKSIFLLICVSLLFSSFTQADDTTKAILKAKTNLASAMNNADEKEIKKARNEFERILQLGTNEWLINYYIALSDYYLSSNIMNKEPENTELLKKYTDIGLKTIEKSIDLKDNFADAFILKLALTFNRWAYESEKMMEIISVTNTTEAKILELDSLNPRYLLLKGISTLYTPENFGGGANVAIPYLQKSCEIFKTRIEPYEIYPDWGRSWAYGFLAMAYSQRNEPGDKEKSKEILDEGLTLMPDSNFLKGLIMKKKGN